MATVQDIDATFRRFDRPMRPAAGLPNPLANVGIGLTKHPLEGTLYTYQVGISSMTMNPSFVEWRARCPGVEPTDGKVSGVVVFNGDEVIGHYTSRAQNHNRPDWHIGVHADHRDKGVITLAMFVWFRSVQFAALVKRPINEAGAKAALTAHKMYLEWAIAEGEPVPQRVIDSMQG